MFENLNWWEIGALLLLAMLIFGDKLPNAISDGLRMVRNLRNMARNATGDLSRELGTDIQLEDLHPKAFIRKHLLSEEDEASLRRPLQSVYDGIKSDLQGVNNDLKDVAAAADPRAAVKPTSAGGPATVVGGAATDGAADEAVSPRTAPASRAIDIDAT